mgnify:CR=1 FL=1
MGLPLIALLLLVQSHAAAGVERFQAGLKMRAEGNHAEARRELEAAWEMGCRDGYLLYSLVEEDRAAGDKAAGLRHFQLLLNNFPDSPWLHVLYADAYLAKDQPDEARNEFAEALRRDPKLPGVAFRAGTIEFRSGAFAKAEELFRKEIELNPAYSDAPLFLAETLRQTGRVDEAIPYYRKAIALDAKAELAYRALAAALADRGDFAGAVTVLEKAEVNFPDDASFAAQLARMLARLHRDAEALRQQERFKQLMQRRRQQAIPDRPAQ